MLVVLYLHDVPKFASTVVFELLTKYIMAKVNKPNSLKVWRIRNEFASELTSTPKAELICSFQTQEVDKPKES